ncbi:PrgI family protein [Streptococcus suis]|uniref:PrgI family protein n=1 Tax=Streptococcus suis TaxID=1307 RepID=UPI000424350E|nr:PrgI family protein [Streptococcus suis]ANC99984.1 type III secretion system protein PrgI [Streptococcus suis]AOM74702.1 type III secretion system protein PrgI [Streptococcus suis]MBS8058126.1 PrgI family protein [Streptococcus suis]MBS8114256.1 PrgI family protein [Streptococcus suis]MCH1644336.1 PrgI family protein [Streptococcus suis]
MTRLGSEFLKALDNYERPIWGYMTLRQVVLLFGIILTVILTVAMIWLQLPSFLIYSIALLLLAPFVIFGNHIDEKIKDELRFFLAKQERTYQTDFDRKDYAANAFIQPKENPETL